MSSAPELPAPGAAGRMTVVGLCGPSELKAARSRVLDFAVAGVDVSPQLADMNAGQRIDYLRQKLIHQVLERLGLINIVGGRHDIAHWVAAFLGSEWGDMDARDVRTRSTGGRGGRGAEHFSSRSCNVDLFFKTVPRVCPSLCAARKLELMLEHAWVEDPEVCLRLLFHLGASRKGKQDRYSFYDGALWLWGRSPATLLHNLHRVPGIIYWKAILEILARVCEGKHLAVERDVVMHQAYAHMRPRLLAQDALAPPVDADTPGWKYMFSDTRESYELGLRVACGDEVEVPVVPGWVTGAVGNGQSSANRGGPKCGWQPKSKLEQATHALHRFDTDALYRALHLRVAALYAEQLATDEARMLEGKPASLAAKWAPLLGGSFDKRTLVAESIARMLYPAHLEEFDGLSEQHYAYRARVKYQKLLTNLKEHRKEPMTLLNAGRLGEIRYKTVPGTCLKLCAPTFMSKDRERFQAFLDAAKTKAGTAKAGALQPHELMRTATVAKPMLAGVAELQWKTMIEEVKKNAKLRSCVAVCDTSSAMLSIAGMDIGYRQKPRGRFDTPPPERGPLRCLDIATALSLVLSEVADHPFRHKVMTFGDRVKLVDLGFGVGTLPARARLLLKRHEEAKREFGKDQVRKFVVTQRFRKNGAKDSVHYCGLYTQHGEEEGQLVFAHDRHFRVVVNGARDGLEACNGEYSKASSINGHASYKNSAGARIFFEAGWKISAAGGAGGAHAYMHGSVESCPPSGQWKAATGDATCDVHKAGCVHSFQGVRQLVLGHKQAAVEAFRKDDSYVFRLVGKDEPVLFDMRPEQKNFLTSNLYSVFEHLLQLKDVPDRIFVFSSMEFCAAVDDDGYSQGVMRDSAGAKLPVFQAAEELYERAGKTMPQVVFWNLCGCHEGSPVVATQPGAVLVSGFSPALVSDILRQGAPDPLALVSNVVSSPLFAPLQVVTAAGDAEAVVRACLDLQGHDARHPSAAAKDHVFAAHEDWEFVESPVVEAKEVEAAGPRKTPLLSVRGVRRIDDLGDVEAREMALIDLIGPRGCRIKEARGVLSMAIAARLSARARVWLDVEYIDDRLGAIAVTVSARTGEDALRAQLEGLLLPAVDSLLQRVRLDADTVASRKRDWESGEWDRAPEEKYGAQRFFGGYGHLPYHVQVQQYGRISQQSASARTFTDADVVPAILAGLGDEAKGHVLEAAKDRRGWPEFPAPRVASTPPPRVPREVDPATQRRAAILMCRARSERAMLRRMAHCPSGVTQVAGKLNVSICDADDAADDVVERKRAERAHHNPRGAAKGSPALGSRKMKGLRPRSANRSRQPGGSGAKDERFGKPRARSHEPPGGAMDKPAAKHASRLQVADADRRRQQSRQRQLARDAKFGV